MKRGFAVSCPNLAIAKKIYGLYVLNGAIHDISILDYIHEVGYGEFCLCYEYNSNRILYGRISYHITSSGLKDWNYYSYSNNIEEILFEKESRVIKKCMDF